MFGYDYGYKPRVLVAGDTKFNEYIYKAQIRGVGYVSIPQSILENKPLEIALLFENDYYGKKVMSCFDEWVKKENGNGDAVGVDIVEDEDGKGYTLCFYQEPTLLIDRLIPEDIKKWINPLVVQVTFLKRIETISQNYYQDFKKALNFSKCYISGGSIKEGYTEFNKIVKSKINVYQANNIPEDSMLKVHFNKDKDILKEDRSKLKDSIIKESQENREQNLKYFYPITYHKVMHRGYLKDIIDELENEFDKISIIQAVCNITLYHRLKKEDMLAILEENNYIELLRYLLEQYESVRSYFPEEQRYTKEQIIKQITEDKKVLLKEMES